MASFAWADSEPERYNNEYRLEGPSEYELEGDSYGQPDTYEQVYVHVPDVIKTFVTYFHRTLRERNVVEILAIYETHFNKLTERFYKNGPWPPAESIAYLVDNDQVFLALYRELYFRHIYSKLQPNMEQRFQSWDNYCTLMAILIESPVLDFELPTQWLWDMIDEYIYQFQSFCQFRAKLKPKSDDEIQILKQNQQVWSVHTVLNNLQDLISKSNIVQTLEREKKYGIEYREGPDGQANMYRMLGYFSLIGLLRVHCLLGDYYLALKAVEPIDFTNKGAAVFTSVIACNITTFYYLGFAYMMMRRYVDCVKNLQHALLYISRTKQFHTRSSYQYEQIMKKSEQMYALLAMAVSLCPQRIDENIQSFLREKYADKLLRLQKGDETCYQELFAFACPKFIVPAVPNFDDAINYNQDAYMLQSRMFLHEVKQQALLPTIRSYLKLYTSIGIVKLADFLGEDQATLRTQLLCLKHKTRQQVWSGGPALDGEWSSSADVDFYLDLDMAHISDTKVTRRYGEYFVRHINKFEEIIESLNEAARAAALAQLPPQQVPLR